MILSRINKKAKEELNLKEICQKALWQIATICFSYITVTQLTHANASPNFVHRQLISASSGSTYVYIKTLTLGSGSYTLKTTNLSTGSDTVMHLWDPVNQVEVAANDDSPSGTGLHSELTVSNKPGGYWVVIYSYSDSSVGQCTLEVTENTTPPTTTTTTGVAFGGAKRIVNSGSASTAAYHIETVPAPGPDGMIASMMFGFECGTGKMIAFDDANGIGLASRIVSPSVCTVVVSPYVHPTTGPGSSPTGSMWLIVNDVSTDNDGDGLGAGLEYAIGTCDSPTVSPPNIDCNPPGGVFFNLADTDHDGLTDYQEVIGIDDLSTPQYLPKWGATPTHKDRVRS